MFLPLYYLFPGTDVTLREVLPGAIFIGMGWTISGIGFRLYAATAESVELFGIVDGVLLFLTWMYLGSLVLLLGELLNAIIGDHVELESATTVDWAARTLCREQPGLCH